MLVPKDTFSARVQAPGDEAHLRLAGRFDASALRVFENAVAQVLNRDVVLDLDGVSFMDGAAWLAVMAHERRAAATSHRLRVINAPGRIRTIFEGTETDQLVSEGGRYAVVQKIAGMPARIARETDLRGMATSTKGDRS